MEGTENLKCRKNNIPHFRTERRSGLNRKPSHLKVCDDVTVAATAVAMQRPRENANKQRQFLGSVNMFPLQRTRTQQ
jgi:hypothetical protein